MYVLLTNTDYYFVEFLIGELIISESLEEAMKFEDFETAKKFKDMLGQVCNLQTSINTFIE